jgi:hypothetical protein
VANTREQEIVLQSSKILADVTYEPFLITRVHLDDEVPDPSGSNAARTDGGDIRTYGAAGGIDELAREIVSFEHDSVTGAGDANIQIHTSGSGWTISSVSNTPMYIQYGDGALTDYATSDTYGRDNVWSSDLFGVYHLEEDPSGSAPQMIDSSGNGNDGTTAGVMALADLVPSQISNGLDMDGGDDEITATGSNTTNFTVSLWTKAPTISGYHGVAEFSNSSGNRRGINTDPSGDVFVTYGAGKFKQSTTPIDDNLYHLTHAGFDGASAFVHVDGVSATLGSELSAGNGVTSVLKMGESVVNGFNVEAVIDEARFYTVARSINNSVFEYNNQNDPATFAIAGTPTAIGGITVYRRRIEAY